jgi:hypothetical protein
MKYKEVIALIVMIFVAIIAHGVGQNSTEPKCSVYEDTKEQCVNLWHDCKGLVGKPKICKQKY